MARRRRALAGLAALSFVTSALGAQQSSAVIGSTYEPGIDVVDYDVRLVLPDTAFSLARVQ